MVEVVAESQLCEAVMPDGAFVLFLAGQNFDRKVLLTGVPTGDLKYKHNNTYRECQWIAL